MKQQTRRNFLQTAGAAASVMAVPGWAFANKPKPDNSMTMGFSLYGMKGMKTEKALQELSNIGYDSAELCLMSEWDATPNNLNSSRRNEIRDFLKNSDLMLSGLMEHVSLTGTAKDQKTAHERLKQAAELGHHLQPGNAPLIETVAGHGKWSELRNQLRDNLGGWAKVAKAAKTVIAVKPHRGGVVDHPEQGAWLVEQIKSPWIKLNFDYSHFAFRDIPLEESIRVMMPHTAFIHVKDTIMKDGKARFLLPGESGQIDYVQLLKLVQQAGYNGDICCEVSSMVFKQPGYDPIVAAKTSYTNVAPAFKKAGISRRKK